MQHLDSTMGGPWGMGIGMLVMLGLVVLLASATIFVVLLLRRAVTDNPGALVRSGAINRLRLPVALSAGPSADTAAREIEGFVVIPDISGYTEFMQLSHFSLAHAQYAVSALLESMRLID